MSKLNKELFKKILGIEESTKIKILSIEDSRIHYKTITADGTSYYTVNLYETAFKYKNFVRQRGYDITVEYVWRGIGEFYITISRNFSPITTISYPISIDNYIINNSYIDEAKAIIKCVEYVYNKYVKDKI